MFAQKNYPRHFNTLNTVIIDEWHELIGSKRGIQIELALSRLKGLKPALQTWGISATIGNLDQALEVLLGVDHQKRVPKIVKANIKKTYKCTFSTSR